jgi:hypothetical protein
MRHPAFLIMAIFLLVPLFAAAQDLTADQIIDKAYDNNLMDFDSATSDLKMDYYEEAKLVNTRKFRVKAIKVTESGETLRRLLLTVTEPADESGTAFLSIENPGDADDDQWLYLSALKKAFRKGGKTGKGESFMGSEFTYGDMESKDVKKAKHKRLPDESKGGLSFYVVESIPNTPADEQYSKYVTYIDKATFIPRIVMFYDMKGQHLKTMTAEQVEKIDNKDTITRAVMVNKQNGNSTRLYLTNIDTKTKLDPADFSKSRMTKM